MSGQYQNNISSLPDLDDMRYENIFRVYQQDTFFYYNIFKTVSFEGIFDSDIFVDVVVTHFKPWPLISHDIYQTTYLWWLLLLTNKIQNPLRPLPTGSTIKAIRPEYVRSVINEIKKQIQ